MMTSLLHTIKAILRERRELGRSAPHPQARLVAPLLVSRSRTTGIVAASGAILDESLSTPVAYHWLYAGSVKDAWIAEFAVGMDAGADPDADATPYHYTVTLETRSRWTPTVWGLYFRLTTETIERKHVYGNIQNYYEPTKTGHEFAVFATVIAIVKDFIGRVKPTCIVFTADEPSRMRLYQRFIGHVASAIPGYVGVTTGHGAYEIRKK